MEYKCGFRKGHLVQLNDSYFSHMNGTKPPFKPRKYYRVLDVFHSRPLDPHSFPGARPDPYRFAIRLEDDRGRERLVDASYFEGFRIIQVGQPKFRKKRPRPEKAALIREEPKETEYITLTDEDIETLEEL